MKFSNCPKCPGLEQALIVTLRYFTAVTVELKLKYGVMKEWQNVTSGVMRNVVS
jgi:hypothetical protein